MLNIPELQKKFAFGDCGTFAIALAEYYDLSIVELHDITSQDFVHAMVEVPYFTETGGPVYLDSLGIVNLTALKHRYHIRNTTIIESSSYDLGAVALIDKDLLPEAKVLIHELIKLDILPIRERCLMRDVPTFG